MKKKPKGPKKIELLTKITEYNDAQNQMKKTKTKTQRKSSSPTLGGTIDYFRKIIQKTKGQETSTSDPQF